MRLRRIFFILILVLALGAVTYALIFDQQTTEPVILTAGSVEFEWLGIMTSDTPVVPGQELIETTFALSNLSTIATELRIMLSVSSSLLGPIVFDDIFETTFGTGWVLETDGYLYYRGVIADQISEPGKYLIPTGSPALDVLSSLVLDGTVVRNNQSGETITITFTFEAKQGGYVEWVGLGSSSLSIDL
ncbi:MAG: hypothetical protein K9K93_05660 [Acholeplasmataceae bacterium]|nr:hypothetical protein [Acholeplasmataceae bacterium]